MRIRFRHQRNVRARLVPSRRSRHGWISGNSDIVDDCRGELALIAEHRSVA